MWQLHAPAQVLFSVSVLKSSHINSLQTMHKQVKRKLTGTEDPTNIVTLPHSRRGRPLLLGSELAAMSVGTSVPSEKAVELSNDKLPKLLH